MCAALDIYNICPKLNLLWFYKSWPGNVVAYTVTWIQNKSDTYWPAPSVVSQRLTHGHWLAFHYILPSDRRQHQYLLSAATLRCRSWPNDSHANTFATSYSPMGGEVWIEDNVLLLNVSPSATGGRRQENWCWPNDDFNDCLEYLALPRNWSEPGALEERGLGLNSTWPNYICLYFVFLIS